MGFSDLCNHLAGFLQSLDTQGHDNRGALDIPNITHALVHETQRFYIKHLKLTVFFFFGVGVGEYVSLELKYNIVENDFIFVKVMQQ